MMIYPKTVASHSSIFFMIPENKWTVDKTLAHGILYIMAGFTTTASSISFLLYEMAKHPDMQKKLLKEIDQALEESDGKLDYETAQKTTYLNKIISGGVD